MDKEVTIVIPTSAIKSHPDTYHIDEVIESARQHFPEAEIIITFDGLHPDFEAYRGRYNDYKTKMLWRCLHEYKNTLPIIFDDHVHQSGMMHRALEEIKTPLILYMEHDAPLVTDRNIDWDKCKEKIFSGEANTIRFHFEEFIPEPHKHLMIGEVEDGFIKTIQWSQRPLLSSKTYFTEMMRYFPTDNPTFIEDEWHGVLINDYEAEDMFGWYKHRLWIYHPDKGIKRSYTTDGREGDKKVGEGFA